MNRSLHPSPQAKNWGELSKHLKYKLEQLFIPISLREGVFSTVIRENKIAYMSTAGHPNVLAPRELKCSTCVPLDSLGAKKGFRIVRHSIANPMLLQYNCAL